MLFGNATANSFLVCLDFDCILLYYKACPAQCKSGTNWFLIDWITTVMRSLPGILLCIDLCNVLLVCLC